MRFKAANIDVNEREPEKALLVAVVERAIKDATQPPNWTKQQEDINEAREWLTSNSEGVMSFLWICEQLNVDADQARQALNRAA